MERFDQSKHAKAADAALVALHDLLAARNAPRPGTFSALEGDARRAYFRDAQRRSRAKRKAAVDAGRLEPTTANVRAALSDAALMLLATNGPGAEQVRTALATVFAARPGALLTIEQRARSGRLRPRLIGRKLKGAASS